MYENKPDFCCSIDLEQNTLKAINHACMQSQYFIYKERLLMYGLPVDTFTFSEMSCSLIAIDCSLSFITRNTTWKIINGIYCNYIKLAMYIF